ERRYPDRDYYGTRRGNLRLPEQEKTDPAVASRPRVSDVDLAEQTGRGLIELVGAAELLELLEEVVGAEALLGGARDVEDQAALVGHDQPVSQRGRVGHRVGDHQGGEVLAAHDLVGEPDDLLGAPGVEGGGVLVEQEQLGASVGGHEQGQRLALAPG